MLTVFSQASEDRMNRIEQQSTLMEMHFECVAIPEATAAGAQTPFGVCQIVVTPWRNLAPNHESLGFDTAELRVILETPGQIVD